MLRAILIAAVLVVVAIGATIAFTSPPKLLSIADGLAGGGSGGAEPPGWPPGERAFLTLGSRRVRPGCQSH